uniref:Uncharacterized protein n=1 Tax=Anguilla anguilla TaxID=7936 RepID=A0A0E9UQP2_ANGAN
MDVVLWRLSGPDQEFTLTAVPHTCRTLTIFTV